MTPPLPARGVMPVILAGGLGSRLAPVLPHTPKVLAQGGGRPFITHLLDQLHAGGFTRALIATGHRGEEVARALGTRCRGVELEYSREERPLGTGGALRLALERTPAPWLLVLNGDSLVELALDAFVRWGLEGRERVPAPSPVAALAAVRVGDGQRYGRLELDPAGGVLGFVEKGAGNGPAWINAGVYLLGREVVATLPLGEPRSLERELLPPLVGHGLRALRCPGRFLDIGTPDAYAALAGFLAALGPPP